MSALSNGLLYSVSPKLFSSASMIGSENLSSIIHGFKSRPLRVLVSATSNT
ncbi:MAG: hypothetical protein IJT70_02390 [Clostridia bacterium]|nr:hypothetical protein [Clostridia bacterium]